jgi:hypothetical protein
MENKKNILEELEKEAPFLSKIKKENNFSTPEKYFKVLPQVIMDKKLNNNIIKFTFDKLSYKFLTPITAVVVLVFVVFNFNSNSISTDLTSDQISQLIIEENYIEIEDYLVYEAYSETLEEGNKTTSENEEYINYLIENDIDINSIIEEL